MPTHFWEKFEWDAWLNDPKLRRCSKETRGFWIDCIATMLAEDKTYFIEGTADQLCRLLSCSMAEFERCIAELKQTDAAEITKCQENVKIVSRRRIREVNLKEYNRLAKEKERGQENVKAPSMSPSKDKSLREEEFKNKKEKEREGKPTSLNQTFPIPRPDTNLDLWNEWLAMRQSIKKPFTQRGYDGLLRDLKILVAFDINERLEMAIDRKWQGLVFKEDKNTDGHNGNGQRKSEREKSADRGENAVRFIDELRRQGKQELAERQALSSGNGRSPETDAIAIKPAEPD